MARTYVTFPLASISVNGGAAASRCSVRSRSSPNELRDAIIAAFAEFEAQQHLAMTG
jgi:hypothetical protein